MSLTWLYDVCFFTIKPFTFHSLTFERPRSLSKSIWIGELPWQLLWSVADTLGWMSDVHGDMFSGVVGEKMGLLWKTHTKNSNVYGLKHRNALDEQVFLPPTKLLPCQGGKGNGGHKGRRLVGNAAEMQRQLGGGSKGTRGKMHQKTCFFFF